MQFPKELLNDISQSLQSSHELEKEYHKENQTTNTN